MKMKKVFLLVLATLPLFMTGCAPKLGGSDYKLDIEKEKEKPTQQSKKSNTKSLKRSESETKRQKLNDASIVNIVKNGLIPKIGQATQNWR